MTVCKACKELCEGLGPFCYECRDEIDSINATEGEPFDKTWGQDIIPMDLEVKIWLH